MWSVPIAFPLLFLAVAGGPGRSYLLIMFTTSFTCRISVRVHCPVVPCFYELSGVVLSCFILSRQTSWMEVFLIQPEYSLISKVKATVYSRSWVRKLVETSGETLCLIIESSVAKLQAPSLIVTVPQAFGPTTIWYCVDWRDLPWFESHSKVQMNVICII